jgi:hypothetical protein
LKFDAVKDSFQVWVGAGDGSVEDILESIFSSRPQVGLNRSTRWVAGGDIVFFPLSKSQSEILSRFITYLLGSLSSFHFPKYPSFLTSSPSLGEVFVFNNRSKFAIIIIPLVLIRRRSQFSLLRVLRTDQAWVPVEPVGESSLFQSLVSSYHTWMAAF